MYLGDVHHFFSSSSFGRPFCEPELYANPAARFNVFRAATSEAVLRLHHPLSRGHADIICEIIFPPIEVYLLGHTDAMDHGRANALCMCACVRACLEECVTYNDEALYIDIESIRAATESTARSIRFLAINGKHLSSEHCAADFHRPLLIVGLLCARETLFALSYSFLRLRLIHFEFNKKSNRFRQCVKRQLKWAN